MSVRWDGVISTLSEKVIHWDIDWNLPCEESYDLSTFAFSTNPIQRTVQEIVGEYIRREFTGR
jgi:hypothetical protein